MESHTRSLSLHAGGEGGEENGTVNDSASDTYRLLDYGEVHSSQQGTTPRQRIYFVTRIENAFRQWGLSSLYIVFENTFRFCFANTYFFIKKHGRVAIFKDHFAAALAALLHIPPIVGTLVITWFVCHEYYIGGELAGPPGYDKEKFLGLQFAAKLQELFMVASLSSIIFTMVRHELALGEGVPFSSLSAGLEIDRISYFWSKEFFALVLGDFSTLWKKTGFIVIIILCTLLGVSVAPATANSLQPIQTYWPAGGTDIWLNNTADLIFPLILDESHTLGPPCAVSGSNNECPSAQWPTLNGEYLSQLSGEDVIVDGLISRSPRGLNVRGRNAMLNLLVHVRAPVYDTYTYNYSVASVPHVAVADAIVLNSDFWDLASRNSTAHKEYRFWYRTGEKYNMPAPSPLTFARCESTTFEAGSLMVPIFPDIRNPGFDPITINDMSVTNWIASTVSNTSRPDLLWFDLPTSFSNSASLGAVVSIPINSTIPSVEIWGCMIDARWASTTLEADRLSRLASGTPGNFNGGWMFQAAYPRAMIRPSFAQYLNPQLPSNSTVFQEMAISVGLWEPHTLQGSGNAPNLETILNLMIVNGMARTAPYTTQQGKIVDFDDGNGPWWRGFMPIPPQVFGPGGNAYDVTSAQQQSSYRLHMQAYALGYAYSKTNGAAWLSIIILLLYVFVAALFVTISLIFGVTSSSWESTAELIALALASPKPETMKNTAAGISTIQPFSDRYCVVAEAKQLQLRQWQGKLSKEEMVQPNVVYG